jgi:hypothetical protein
MEVQQLCEYSHQSSLARLNCKLHSTLMISIFNLYSRCEPPVVVTKV